MNGLDIVMVFAIILFARLGVRLVTQYIKMKKEDTDEVTDADADADADEKKDNILWLIYSGESDSDRIYKSIFLRINERD